jgi:hypothetical protein
MDFKFLSTPPSGIISQFIFCLNSVRLARLLVME